MLKSSLAVNSHLSIYMSHFENCCIRKYFLTQISALKYAVQMVRRYLPELKVYPAVGNHESAPVNRYMTSFIFLDNFYPCPKGVSIP